MGNDFSVVCFVIIISLWFGVYGIGVVECVIEWFLVGVGCIECVVGIYYWNYKLWIGNGFDFGIDVLCIDFKIVILRD